MHRRKILWLTSWYPNRNDPFDGDFIQRHARAAAIYHDIHVIFVTEAPAGEKPGDKITRATGLTEQIVYEPRTTGLLGRLRRVLRWRDALMRAVSDHILAYGMPELVHVHVPWKAGLIALWTRRKYDLPFIVSEHWGSYTEWRDDTMQAKLLRQIYTQAAAVVTVSDYLSKLIEGTAGRAATHIIPNVVDTTLFRPGGEKYERFTFIHVSNMMPVKNVGGILDAFAQLLGANDGPPAQLVLVGNRDDAYVRKAKELGLLNDTVFFRGEVPYTEVAEEMRRAHCLVLFSDSETFSCVTAEALCCGLPVIATEAGALPELVTPGNGLLVRPGDVKGLAAAMGAMLAEKERATSHQGSVKSAYAKVTADAAGKWSYGAVAERFDELYSGLNKILPRT